MFVFTKNSKRNFQCLLPLDNATDQRRFHLSYFNSTQTILTQILGILGIAETLNVSKLFSKSVKYVQIKCHENKLLEFQHRKDSKQATTVT